MKKHLRPIRWLVAITTAALALGACSSGGSGQGTQSGAAGDRTEITFLWLWGEAEDQVLRELVEEFNASQDEIFVKGVSSPDTVKQLAAMTSTSATFDVSDYFSNSTAAWAEMGIIAPLDEYIERDNFDLSDFVPPALEQNKYDGKLYALPVSTVILQLYYNKELLAEAGFDKPPATLEELAEYTAALTKTDDAGNITQLGFYGPWPAAIMNTLAYAHGGSFYGTGDTSAGPNPDNPGAQAALDFYYQNVIEPFGATKVQEFTSGFGAAFTPDFPLYNGSVAMFVDGAYHNTQISTFAPDLEYGVAPIPVPADDPESAKVAAEASTIFIPANSKKKDEAWEFVKFLFKKENVLRFNKSQTNLPPFTSAADDPIFDELPEGFHVFLEALKSPNLTASPAEPWNAEYSNELNVIFEGFTSGRVSSPDTMQALNEAAAKFQQ